MRLGDRPGGRGLVVLLGLGVIKCRSLMAGKKDVIFMTWEGKVSLKAFLSPSQFHTNTDRWTEMAREMDQNLSQARYIVQDTQNHLL